MSNLIYKKMTEVMADIGAVQKGRRNQQQGYAFRGIDEVYAELHPAMSKHGVFMTSEIVAERTEEKTTKSGGLSIYRILTIRFTFWAEDGSSIQTTVVGEGMDSGDKASNKAMSVAQKYALLQAFLIPTEESKDPENDSHELKAKQAVQTSVNTPAEAPKPAAPKVDTSKILVEFGQVMNDKAMSDSDRENCKRELKEVGKDNLAGLEKLLAVWRATLEARKKPAEPAVEMSAADLAGLSKAFDEVGLF